MDMRLTFFCGWPYRFDAETDASGEVHYFVVDLNNEERDTVQVTPETWDRLVRAAQGESISLISSSLDYGKQAAVGKIPSIAERLNDIAHEMLACEDCGREPKEHQDHEVWTPGKKDDEGVS